MLLSHLPTRKSSVMKSPIKPLPEVPPPHSISPLPPKSTVPNFTKTQASHVTMAGGLSFQDHPQIQRLGDPIPPTRVKLSIQLHTLRQYLIPHTLNSIFEYQKQRSTTSFRKTLVHQKQKSPGIWLLKLDTWRIPMGKLRHKAEIPT